MFCDLEVTNRTSSAPEIVRPALKLNVCYHGPMMRGYIATKSIGLLKIREISCENCDSLVILFFDSRNATNFQRGVQELL